MRVTLKDFQVTAVAELRAKLMSAQKVSSEQPAAALLNAPTGSGKTLIATALIEDLLFGDEERGTVGDDSMTFLWLTDQPELNRQTYDKMRQSSGVLGAKELVIIDASFDVESLVAGKVYFLNTQKLGSATSFVKSSESRQFSLWDTIAETIKRSPARFVLIVDEAHRGAKGKDVEEAETILQRFVKGDKVFAAVPLVLGISATPERFVKLCSDTNRPLFKYDIDPQVVRESGLLKEYVDLYHPSDAQPSDVTMLREATKSYLRYCDEWADYGKIESITAPTPVMLVQVADAKAGSKAYSTTDLELVVETLAKELVPEKGYHRWIAHAFQNDSDIDVGGRLVRYLAPSEIDADTEVRVVLFKTSLNTGWDCPRAETMVSFRTAKDETNITQLVGRMVRAPLARRIESNAHLNSVALYLPFYDATAVKKVIGRLTSDAENVPPTHVREGGHTVALHRAPGTEECFKLLAQVPSYTVPRVTKLKPIVRLGRLAGLLAEVGAHESPTKYYRTVLTDVLNDERERRTSSGQFQKAIDEASKLNLVRSRVSLKEAIEAQKIEQTSIEAPVAEENVEDLFSETGRLLGEGLHREYMRRRILDGTIDPIRAKLEVYVLASAPEVASKVDAVAEKLRKEWMTEHRPVINAADEKHRQAFREIAGSGGEPETSTLHMPRSIEGAASGASWSKHIYVTDGGQYFDELDSSWETRVVKNELKRDDIVAWWRNIPRRPWSLCVPRTEGTGWTGVYPDFLFFRKVGKGVVVDVVDPHLLADENAAPRAAALARFANSHIDVFGRFELVLFASDSDEVGRRLDLNDESRRAAVSKVSSSAELRTIFTALGS